LARQGRPILYGALLSFSPFALTVVIAACGVVFENQGGFTSAGLVSLQGLVILLLILQVFLSVVLMWRLRRIYILVVTVQALAFWVSLGAGFLAILFCQRGFAVKFGDLTSNHRLKPAARGRSGADALRRSRAAAYPGRYADRGSE